MIPQATASITPAAELGGASARLLRNNNYDLGVLRPWSLGGRTFGSTYGPSYVTVNTGQLDDKGEPIYVNKFYSNASALLRREDWLRIDQEITWDEKFNLTAWADLYGTNPYNFDALPWPVIQRAIAQGHATATLSMDGMRKGERDRPILDVVNLPMPITHSDGNFSLRDILVSEKSGMPLDTTGIRESNRACDELTEKMTIGLLPIYTFGSGSIWGYRNNPYRYTKLVSDPATTTGWTGATLYTQILAALQTMLDDMFRGPFMLYYGSDWFQYFANDYNTTYPTNVSVLDKILALPNIAGAKQLDYLPTKELLLVEMQPKTARGVQGMQKRVVQWQHGSGMEEYYKVMCIRVVETRYNFRQKIGIMHMTATAGGTTTTTTSTTTTTTTP